MVPALKDLKHDFGSMPNMAIAMIEEENNALAGAVNWRLYCRQLCFTAIQRPFIVAKFNF